MNRLPVSTYSVELRTTVTQLVHVRAISRREAIGIAEDGGGTLIEEEVIKRTAVYVTETDPVDEDEATATNLTNSTNSGVDTEEGDETHEPA